MASQSSMWTAADPLRARADATSEAPPGQPPEPVECRGVVVEDDPRAHHDEAIGVGAIDRGLPGPGDARHLGWAVGGLRRLVEDAVASVAIDRQRAGLRQPT